MQELSNQYKLKKLQLEYVVASLDHELDELLKKAKEPNSDIYKQMSIVVGGQIVAYQAELKFVEKTLEILTQTEGTSQDFFMRRISQEIASEIEAVNKK